MYKTTLGVHDPTIIYSDLENEYYMYSTDTQIDGVMSLGVQIRKSNNLQDWIYIGTALQGIPESVYPFTTPGNLWAPEVIFINDEYRMYYSASIFGTNKSCINLAVSKTPEGPWIDRGLVISSNPDTDEQNAIDANVLFDKDGHQWMVYGSFFSGIYIVELDPNTGLILNEGDIGKCIANRSSNVEGALEGPFIYYNESLNYYYLFVSYDFLGSSYNIRVARSRNIDGPYVDYNGLSMFEDEENPHSIGLKILGSYRISPEVNWTSIGHNSILDINEKQYIVAHSRINHQQYPHYAYIREIVWLSSGWPVSTLQNPTEILDINLDGRWVFGVIFNPLSTESMISKTFQIKESYDYVSYKCILEDGNEVTAVSGIDSQGQTFMAYIREEK